MSKSSQEILHEGWLTKSPPNKRIWGTAKWRRRWFALKQSADIPGSYFLEYYADRNYRKLKGIIALDMCDQVDAGLCMERSGAALPGNKLKGSVFSIKTQARTYHLEADSEEEMERWVAAICSACGFRSSDGDKANDTMYEFRVVGTPEAGQSGDPSPYIPIFECITGPSGNAPVPDNNAAAATTRTFKFYGNHSAPLRITSNVKPKENESTDDSMSDDEGAISIRVNGPPVPPRPATTYDDPIQRQKAHEQLAKQQALQESDKKKEEIKAAQKAETMKEQQRAARKFERSPAVSHYMNTTPNKGSPKYSNINSLFSAPPAVDRNLKPRRDHYNHNTMVQYRNRYMDKLQYLDLDLATPCSPRPTTSKVFNYPDVDPANRKCLSATAADMTNYRVVDFVKTEAFNLMRQDVEACRAAPFC